MKARYEVILYILMCVVMGQTIMYVTEALA
jgi:hypothetical protein